MALVLMTNEELKAIGINTQHDSDLDLINGIFYKSGWRIVSENIENNATVFINEYYSDKYDVSIFLKQVQEDSTVLNGIKYGNFQFYKEV